MILNGATPIPSFIIPPATAISADNNDVILNVSAADTTSLQIFGLAATIVLTVEGMQEVH
ncbi:hypothetical protein [Bacillus sp. SD075]|uniref:hypothetical protein n=1 Tax=Bacillus sp. SD075 TaxID=2781732 RepID=UPI0025703743|nr:hypothetical protein [Bacillus sp. SD075]